MYLSKLERMTFNVIYILPGIYWFLIAYILIIYVLTTPWEINIEVRIEIK